jgi:ABC-type methionine transport system permease subunit
MTVLSLHDYLIAFWQTIYTVLVSSSTAIIIGLCLGCLIHQLENKKQFCLQCIYWCIDIIVNLGRSTPFIILLIALIPITRWIVGTSIGVNAALVPLTIAAIPFYARVTQSALKELPPSVLL